MNSSLRLITLLIALLIAGKEAIALGHAISSLDSVSWSDQGGDFSEPWLLEYEGEEETDKQDDHPEYSSSSPLFKQHYSSYPSAFLIASLCKSSPEYVSIHPEFYIYVLNLRL